MCFNRVHLELIVKSAVSLNFFDLSGRNNVRLVEKFAIPNIGLLRHVLELYGGAKYLPGAAMYFPDEAPANNKIDLSPTARDVLLYAWMLMFTAANNRGETGMLVKTSEVAGGSSCGAGARPVEKARAAPYEETRLSKEAAKALSTKVWETSVDTSI